MSDKKVFDKEYATSYMKEKQWLDNHGVPYEFVKVVDGITIYKYKKTSSLYGSLFEFYSNLEDLILEEQNELRRKNT